MVTVSNAPSVEGLENVRKARWAELNKKIESVCRAKPLAMRRVAILSRLYLLPEDQAIHAPTVWTQELGTYCMAERNAPYNRVVVPGQKARLVCDHGFMAREQWSNPAFWWEATEAVGFARTPMHLNDLAEKQETFWFRDHSGALVHAVQLDQEMADLVNAIDVQNGSVPAKMVDVTSLNRRTSGEWTFNLVDSPAYVAKEGDWLGGSKLDGYFEADARFPYNGARLYPRAFFEERARFIDELR